MSDFEDIYYTCQKNPNLPDVKFGKFSAKNYRSLGVKDVAHSVKSDNPDILKKWIGIKKIADHIINQNVLTPKDTIIPAPQHTGRAEYTLEIAKIVSEQTGCKIADVLGCVPRDTLYNLKKRHGSSSITDSGIYLLNNKFPKYNVWFLDNVTATGTTFNDARKLIPHIKPLIYSISPRLKVKMKNRKPYFIRESNNYKKLEEGPSPKWKQKILDDINEIFDIVYPIVNDENGEWKEPEKYLSFSVNKFIALIKTLIDAEKYSENLLKYAAIDLWIDLHCDDSVGDFNDSETQIKYAKYHNLRKELWNALCDEYQTKYGRKRQPQPYIKDPTDASEIFDKVYQLRHENRNLKMDFEKIYKSANQ